MADHDVQVQVRFTVSEDGYPSYSDALYFPIDEWPVSAKRLEAAKAERFAAFKAQLDEAAAVVPEAETEPTPDDRAVQAAELADRAADLAQQFRAIADSFTAEAPADGA